MKPETIAKIFEYMTGLPFENFVERVASGLSIAVMPPKKKRHAMRYLRSYIRRGGNPQATEISKERIKYPMDFMRSTL